LLDRAAAVTVAAAAPRAQGRVAAVLWDVDGTLFDSHAFSFVSTNAVLTAGGFAPTDAAGVAAGSALPTPQRLAWHATRDASAPCGAALGAAFDAHYTARVDARTPPLIGAARAALDALREARPALRFGLLTNAAGGYARALLAAHGGGTGALRGFGAALGAGDVAALKPAPDGLQELAAALGVAPEACAYVGDAPSDGAAARAAGMFAIGVWRAAPGGDAEADAEWGASFDAVAGDAGALVDLLLQR